MRPSRPALLATAWVLAAVAIAPPALALDAAPATSSGDWRTPVQKILRDVRRIPSPPGIEETRAVRIGGIEQWISVRGKVLVPLVNDVRPIAEEAGDSATVDAPRQLRKLP